MIQKTVQLYLESYLGLWSKICLNGMLHKADHWFEDNDLEIGYLVFASCSIAK